MKKIVFLFILLALFVTGCTVGSGEGDGEIDAASLDKAQAIAVVDASGNLRETITDPAKIKDFVAALDVDNWDLSDLPSDAKAIGSFGLSQEKTIHFGEKANDGKLYDVGLITLYDQPMIRCSVVGLDVPVAFTLPQDAYEKLRAYFQ